MKKFIVCLLVLLFCSNIYATLMPTANIPPFETSRITLSPASPQNVGYVTLLGLTTTSSIKDFALKFESTGTLVFDTSHATFPLIFEGPTWIHQESPNYFVAAGRQGSNSTTWVGPGMLFKNVYMSGQGTVNVTLPDGTYLGSFIVTPEPSTLIMLTTGVLVFLRRNKCRNN